MNPQYPFYLIEEYEEEVQRVHSCSAYDVQGFKSVEELKRAILEGPKHKGKLIPTKLIPIKLELIVD